MTGGDLDLPLDETPASRFLAAIIGGMVYLAVLAFAIASAAHQSAESARAQPDSVTLSMPAGADPPPDRLERVVALSRSFSGVGRAIPLSSGEVRRLFSEWLAQDERETAELPLPEVVDIEIADREAFDVEAFEAAAREIEPRLVLDTSMLTAPPIGSVAPELRALAAIAGFALLCAGVGVIVLVTRMSLDLHDDTVDLLKMMGAGDLYVARQFERHALSSATRGAIGGYALAWLTLLGFAAGGVAWGDGFGLGLDLRAYDWVALGAVPIVFTILTTAGARMTALWSLGRMR